MASRWLVTGATLGGLAVVLGAFGAHGLETRVDAEMLAVFETGVRYHMYHALALLVVGLMAVRRDSAWIRAAGWFFLAGVVVFSGSLYLLTMTGVRWLGAITPIGGVALIVGWAALAVGALHGKGRGTTVRKND
jgi:uncharacterized membrane protein YgdD (TMEM256/DUF423 family)